jgi:hypothetical protein
VCGFVSVSEWVSVYVFVSVFVYVSVCICVCVCVCAVLSLGRPQLPHGFLYLPSFGYSLCVPTQQTIYGVKLFEQFGHILFDVLVLFSGVP